MLDIQFVLAHKDLVLSAIRNKQQDSVDLDALEELYKKRQALVQKLDGLYAEKKKNAQDRNDEKGKEIKHALKETEDALKVVTTEITPLLDAIPNVPLPDVPIGKDESENVVKHTWGTPNNFSFTPKPHWDLGVSLDIIDSVRGAKVAGSRFSFLKGGAAMLQFALVQFALSVVTNEKTLQEIAQKANLNIPITPFIPIIPPAMITPQMLYGMARLQPKEDKFFIEKDDVFLAGSAEHTLGAMHAGEIFEESDLPLRYVGYSTAFRREAGSYGQDTKGILRQHQFDKLEFETFTVAEQSRTEQDFLVAIQEYLMQQLELPYQVVAVCTGDMGLPDLRQIDIETWMPGQGVYRETHSADLMGEYQARRLGIKVKRAKGEKEFVHMNDATTFAIGRTLIAIMENYQQEDGSIEIPKALQPFTTISTIS